MVKAIDALALFAEVTAFRDSLNAETDRGCALMAAAYLDEELQKLFRATFLDDSGVADQLFSPNGPLGTFSARIDLAYMREVWPNSLRILRIRCKSRRAFGPVKPSVRCNS